MLDVKIFDNSWNVSDKIVLDALIKVITEYPNIKIFNLSLNSTSNSEVLLWVKSFLTRAIDSIIYQYKVIVITSSWNHGAITLWDYPIVYF